jgi:hypothetical protein
MARLIRRTVVAIVVVVVLPIPASTCSGWWFQLDVMRSAGLTRPLAGMVATAPESRGLTFAGPAHQARAANDSAATYQAAMWAVVAAAAALSYSHGSAGWQRPGLTGMVFATLSVGSVAGWELRERQGPAPRPNPTPPLEPLRT